MWPKGLDQNTFSLRLSPHLPVPAAYPDLIPKGSEAAFHFSAPSAPISVSLRELRLVTSDEAKATLSRLLNGYDDKSGAVYGPAVRNDTGCLLA